MAFGIEAFNAAGGLLFDSNATCYRLVSTGRTRLSRVYAGHNMVATPPFTTIDYRNANYNIVLVRPPIGFPVHYTYYGDPGAPFGSIYCWGYDYIDRYIDYAVVRRVSDYGGSGVSHGIRAHASNGRVTFDSGYRYPTLTASYNIKTIAHTDVTLPHSHSQGVYVVLNPLTICHVDGGLDIHTWYMATAFLNQTRVRMGPVQHNDNITGGNHWHLPGGGDVRHADRTTVAFMRLTG